MSKKKPIHRARLVSDGGGVSALCYTVPRPINLNAATWTIRDESVTCKRCLARMPADE